ncbi:hypothetical protein D9Q98_009160 [Chlorella vulgaris]|uniref:Clathrin light chain n=1 Tax=Chlorella vulgaris TaxID=3077 RepID=A0A9D4TNX9_CHLVU|nr:hypothetical protein D9Q98_009160 [Chlorella vulgaris]
MSGDLQSQVFADKKGETLVSAPGSINGEGFVIKNLEECSVFILDYSSEVEVTNCTNCQIFVGPVDGPVLFQDCSNCQVAAACHLFKAQNCTSCEFGLYTSTQPAIAGCSGIRIACWAGAYPQLTQHFAAANLDPLNNQWNKVYDGSAQEGGPPNFELVQEPTAYWEVPLDNFGPPDNPVPGPDGSLYQPSAAPTQTPSAPGGDFGASEAAAATANGFGGGGGELGGASAGGGAISDDFLGEHLPSGEAATQPSGLLEPAAAGGDHPTVSDAKQRLQQRMREQAEQEAEQKKGLQASASKFLEQFYERRTKSKEERIRVMREALEGKGNGELGPSGGTEPERVLSMIDFSLSRPNGTDLSRFKSVLLTCKSKGSMPTAAA